MILQSSLQPDKYADTVQFSTVRRFRSAYSNVYQASSLRRSESHGDGQGHMQVGSHILSYLWRFFKRFMKGMHKPMGEIIHPDRALSLNVLKEIMVVLDREWEESNTGDLMLAQEALFYLITFCCALRGEEVTLTNLLGMKNIGCK